VHWPEITISRRSHCAITSRPWQVRVDAVLAPE
jgi:hypothetical protein